MLATRSAVTFWRSLSPASAAALVQFVTAPSGKFRADAKHVADNEHSDHQHRIDRRPANPGVLGRQFGIDPAQIKDPSDPPNGMILRDRVIKPKRIEKPWLRRPIMFRSRRESHHRNGIIDLNPLQQTSATNRHQADLPACPLFGRYRRESGH
jgi:hypothetical protein